MLNSCSGYLKLTWPCLCACFSHLFFILATFWTVCVPQGTTRYAPLLYGFLFIITCYYFLGAIVVNFITKHIFLLIIYVNRKSLSKSWLGSPMYDEQYLPIFSEILYLKKQLISTSTSTVFFYHWIDKHYVDTKIMEEIERQQTAVIEIRKFFASCPFSITKTCILA